MSVPPRVIPVPLPGSSPAGSSPAGSTPTGTATPGTPAAPRAPAADSASLRRKLERMGDTESDGEELYFDAVTGKLVLKKKNAPAAPDENPVTSIARDGFFAA